jgi:hypothetical protein
MCVHAFIRIRVIVSFCFCSMLRNNNITNIDFLQALSLPPRPALTFTVKSPT